MCVPLTANGGIGVTACLLGNRLTNNLLRGIGDMKKMEDQRRLSLCRALSLRLILISLVSLFFCASFPLCSRSFFSCYTLAFRRSFPLTLSPHSHVHQCTIKSQCMLMLSKVTPQMHRHTAHQTLMQQPHCWLSHPVCTGDWTNHRYACCKAFYRYKEGCLTLQPLLSVLASYCPCRASGGKTLDVGV